MSTTVIGIDPGVHGSVATISHNGAYVYDISSYKIGNRLRTCDATLAHELSCMRIDNESLHAFVEIVHSMPKQGVASTFSFGESFGIIRGVLAALDIPYELVTPQNWKKAMGVPRGGDKKASVPVAIRLFPKLVRELTSKKHGGTADAVNLDGRADALLIAEYGRRLLGNA